MVWLNKTSSFKCRYFPFLLCSYFYRTADVGRCAIMSVLQHSQLGCQMQDPTHKLPEVTIPLQHRWPLGVNHLHFFSFGHLWLQHQTIRLVDTPSCWTGISICSMQNLGNGLSEHRMNPIQSMWPLLCWCVLKHVLGSTGGVYFFSSCTGKPHSLPQRAKFMDSAQLTSIPDIWTAKGGHKHRPHSPPPLQLENRSNH